MMTNRTDVPSRNRNGYLFGIYLLALAVCLVANLGTRIAARADWGPPWGRTIVAAVSVVPLVVACNASCSKGWRSRWSCTFRWPHSTST
jgi:hypothetical protein